MTNINSVPTSINKNQVACIANAVSIIGNKWTALIINCLFDQPLRFCQLEEAIGKINPRTLTQKLAYLESIGIISRTSYRQCPPKVEYSLTSKGRSLLPIFQQMAAWSNQQ